jgi:hypothetical protein
MAATTGDPSGSAARPYAPDFRDRSLHPVPGLIGRPALIAIACEADLVNPRNYLIEQLCASLFDGADFLGYPTNQCRVMLASPESYDIRERGIIPSGVDLRDCPKPIPAPDADDDMWLKAWQREWVGGVHEVVVLGPWDSLRRGAKQWFEYELGYSPRNDENARKALYDDYERWLVRMLKDSARDRGITVIVCHVLNGHGDRLGCTIGLHEAHSQIWLRRRGGGYLLVVPEHTKNLFGPACTIPLDRDENGRFYRVDENGDEEARQANFKGNEASQHPVDEQIKNFLAARPGRHTRKMIVECCGEDWSDKKVRAKFNDALRRRLVKNEEVIRYEPDADAGYPEITYSMKQ